MIRRHTQCVFEASSGELETTVSQQTTACEGSARQIITPLLGS